MLSIIIPSRKEKFLNKTILDVLKNARGEIEVIPVLDGYVPDEIINDPRVSYIRLPEVAHTQKRHGINEAVKQSKGKYVMALDAHCLVAEGFDLQLIKDHRPHWVQVPRRHRLDADYWCIQPQSDNRPPIDYEYLMYPFKYHSTLGNREPKKSEHQPELHGFKWDARTLVRADILIDETLTIQGSCWFMTKDWFYEIELMQIEGFTGWGQEGEEIALKTWLAGGKVMTNKNTYYAHLHKGPKHGRGYFMSKRSMRACNKYSFDFFVNDRWHKRISNFNLIIEHFMPLPNWSPNWKEEFENWKKLCSPS